MSVYYSDADAHAKKIPITHEIILAELERQGWEYRCMFRDEGHVWVKDEDEILVPIYPILRDYYSLCFDAGLRLGLIEKAWKVNI